MIDIQSEVADWLASKEGRAEVFRMSRKLEAAGVDPSAARTAAMVRAAVWKAVELCEANQ